MHDKYSNLGQAAAQTDSLVEEFLRFLQDSGMMENTIVFLFPDHHYMGAHPIIQRAGRRKLWMMTNYEIPTIDTANFYQIDLLPAILAGADVKHNAVFLTDLIHGSKNDYINEHTPALVTLNSHALTRRKTFDNFMVNLHDGMLFLTNNQDTIMAMPSVDTTLYFDDGCRIISRNDDWDYYMTELKIMVKGNVFDISTRSRYMQHSADIAKDTNRIEWAAADIFKYLMTDSVHTKKYYAFPLALPLKNERLPEYLEQILQDSSKIALIACSDEASVYFAWLHPVLQKYGITESLEGRFRWSYLAAFSNNHIYCQKAAPRAIYSRMNIAGIPVFMTSAGADYGWFANIVVGNRDYSLGGRGLNIAVLDTRTKRVTDAFYVDVCGDSGLTIHR